MSGYRWINLNQDPAEILDSENCYGDIVWKDPESGKHLSVMCGHGGSMYCCGACTKAMLEGKPAPVLPCPVHPPGLQFSTMSCRWPTCVFNGYNVGDVAEGIERLNQEEKDETE